MRLNDVALRAIPTPAKGQTKIFDDSLHGFGVRVSQGGTRTFFLQVGSDRRFISLGRYPVISLQNARSEAKRLLAEFTLGRLRPERLSWSDAVRLYLADKEKTVRPRTLADYRRILTLHFPFKGQLIDVTNAQVAHRLERLKDTPSEHNHARTCVMIFFNWCMERRYITSNPAVGISPYERKRRSRVLSDAELKSIWEACEQTGGDGPATAGGAEAIQSPRLPAHFATIVTLLILLGQREGETASFQKSWIDLENKIVAIPENVAKNGNEHTVPLPSLALSVLRLPLTNASAFLFPAKNKSNKAFCGFGKAKIALDKLCGVTGWTLHDIRRTFRSNLGKLGVAPHIAERLVNHISARTDMERTYDLWTYLPEMRTAMEKWEAHLLTIVDVEPKRRTISTVHHGSPPVVENDSELPCISEAAE